MTITTPTMIDWNKPIKTQHGVPAKFASHLDDGKHTLVHILSEWGIDPILVNRSTGYYLDNIPNGHLSFNNVVNC